MIYFGTDGIRGVVNEEITQEICFKCGNALAKIKENCKIVLATDTRTSNGFLLTSFASGAILAGAQIDYAGIMPTPSISFLVQKNGYDFGVMLTASHNPPEYNGIKIFGKDGRKIDVETENLIEKNFAKQKICNYEHIGKFLTKTNLQKQYESHIVKIGESLKGLKIVVDASNGANYSIAQKVFAKLGADCTFLNCKNDGININNSCGALHPENLAKTVIEKGADIGFAFDGDADRIVVVDEKGHIVDGDQILLYIAKMYKMFGYLKSDALVSTIQSNMALKEQLEKLGLKLYQTDIGDRNVTDLLLKNNLQIGGEQAGHIILTEYGKTGDGLLTAVVIAKLLKKSKQKLSENLFFDLYFQIQKNIKVTNKEIYKNNGKFFAKINRIQKNIKYGRILVRPSGTEPILRILVETKDPKLAEKYAQKIEKIVLNIEKGKN